MADSSKDQGLEELGTYVKKDRTREVTSQAGAVTAKFDGYALQTKKTTGGAAAAAKSS